MCPEVKINRETFPEHLYQWLYDEDNPLQKKIFPAHSLIEMSKMIKYVESLVKLAKSKKEESLLKKINVPVMIILGDLDTVISNSAAKSLFEGLPDDNER
jgi:esterase/lipase